MNKETNKLIPELRFPEFLNKEEWIYEPLDKTYRFLVTNSLSRENLNYQSGLVKNIHYGDIHTKFSTLFDILKEKVPYINPEVSIDRISQDNYCQQGDMVFADASEDIQDVGKSIEITNLNNEKLLSGLHTLLARQIEQKLITGFGGYLFKSEPIRKQIQKEAQGTKVLSISATRISKINIYYPKSPIEQKKIADCLSSLDELITAHTEKLETLKTYKKGMMQNLFPQGGQNVPKFRFKEFEKDGEWKKKSFDKLFEIGNGRDYKHLNKGKIPVYGTGGYMLSVDDFLYDGESACIGRKGTIDKPMFLEGKFWTVDTLFYTHSFKECLPKFIFYIFQNIDWKKHNEAGGVPSLSKANIYRIEVLTPKPNEQQKIVDILTSLDDLIKEQNDHVEELKLHKKALMQGLFPKARN